MSAQDKLSLLVSQKEHRILLAATLLDQPFEGFVKRAQLEGDRYRLRLTVKQLKAFVDYLDFEKAWLRSEEKRQAVKIIVSRLRGCLGLLPLMKRYTSLTA